MKVWVATTALVAFFAVGGWYMWHGDTPYTPPAPTAAAVEKGAAARITAARSAAETAPTGSTRVLLVGNSLAYYIGSSFKAIPSVAVLDAAVTACTFPSQIVGQRIALADGASLSREPCAPAWESDVVRAFHPSIVFWLDDDPPRGGGTYRGKPIAPCSATYDALYERDLRAEIAKLGATGATVVVTTSAYSGIAGHGDDRADDCQNRAKRAAVARSTARLVDLAAFVCPSGHCVTKRNGLVLRPDGFHYEGPGGEFVARWLLGQVRGT